MKIELRPITVREVVDGYQDNAEAGVVGFGGKLDIRPPYQREFVYDDKKRNLVIQTIMRGYPSAEFPLNVMYWAKTDDDHYELIDGQQRTISFCQYHNNEFSIDIDGMPQNFSNLSQEKKDYFLNYKLQVYVCEGTHDDKIEWFNIINVAGEPLTQQEILNANFTGAWLSSAKLYFMKSNSPAYLLANKYVDIEANQSRGKGLETAISWVSGGNVKQYMSDHQQDANADELWTHFKTVIEWVQATFTTYRAKMKGIDWGRLYNEYHGNQYEPAVVEAEVAKLYANDEVDNHKGVYEFVLKPEKTYADEKLLSKRTFSETDRETKYEQQNHKCAICGQEVELENMHADHITPWSDGGKTTLDNLQMLCRDCNLRKSAQKL